MVRAVVIALLVLAGSASCQPDYSGTHFKCDLDHTCPSGQACTTAGTCAGGSVPDPGPYAIAVKGSSPPLTLQFPKELDNTPLQLQSGSVENAQPFNVFPTDAYYRVETLQEFCLDLDARDQNVAMQLIHCENDDSTGVTQDFDFEPSDPTDPMAYTLEDAYTNQCLGAGTSPAAGGMPRQYDCTASNEHLEWSLIKP